MAKKKKKPSALSLKPVLGDCVATCLWVVVSSFIGEAAEKISELDVLKPSGLTSNLYGIEIALLLVLLFIFTPLCSLLWGAIFNPVNNLAMWASGKGKASENVLRMGAQVAGALAGSMIATTVVPSTYQGKFQNLAGRLMTGIQLEKGFACEALLGLASNLVFLFSLDARSKLLAFWVPLVATAAWCYMGSYFTGPSMNPAQAFSWNWHYQQHTLQEHLIVFWLGPFVGAGLAGVAYLWLAPQRTTAVKKERSAAPVTKAAPKAAPAAPKAAAVTAPAAAVVQPVTTASTVRKRAGKATAAASSGPTLPEPEAVPGKAQVEEASAPGKAKKKSKVAAAGDAPTTTLAPVAAVVAAQSAPADKAKRKKADKSSQPVVENGWTLVPVRSKAPKKA